MITCTTSMLSGDNHERKLNFTLSCSSDIISISTQSIDPICRKNEIKGITLKRIFVTVLLNNDPYFVKFVTKHCTFHFFFHFIP